MAYTSSSLHQTSQAESLVCLDLSLGGIFSAPKRKCSASFSSQKLDQPCIALSHCQVPPSKQYSSNSIADQAPPPPTTLQQIPHESAAWSNSPFQFRVLATSESLRVRRGAHQSESDVNKSILLAEACPTGPDCPTDAGAAAACQETPSFVSIYHHSPTFSCTLSATRGHDQADLHKSCSLTRTASCLPSSSRSFLPSSGMSRAFCNGVNGYGKTTLQTSTDGNKYMQLPSKRKPCDGKEVGVNCMLPKPNVFEKEGTKRMRRAKRKPSLGNEESKSSHSSSSELLENGGTLEYEQSSVRNRAAEIEAPRSRCGSNSDIAGSMDPSLVVPSTCTMLNTHPFAMLPVPSNFSVPIQWAFPLPYAMHHPSFLSHKPPENTSLPWSPFVFASPSAQKPGASPHDESKLQSNQGTSCQKKGLTCALILGTPLVEEANVPPLSYIVQESKPHASMSEPVIDMPTSALGPLSSPQTAHFSSISHEKEVRPSEKVCASTQEPVNFVCASAMSSRPLSSPLPKANFSSMLDDSELHQNDQLNASKSSVARADFVQQRSKSPCVQKTDDVSFVCSVQSQHSVSPRRKLAKTVRFAPVIEEADSVKSNSNRDGTSSVLSRMCESEMDDSCEGQSYSDERSAREHDLEEGSENTGIASESSDQEGAPSKVNRGKLEGKIGELPWVTTTGAGPNGKTIFGVMYITKRKRACLICSCHGTHMSPSEFVEHSGSSDLSNPERSIVVGGFPFVDGIVRSERGIGARDERGGGMFIGVYNG